MAQKKTEVRGIVTVDVDPGGLRAVVRLEPGEGLNQWSTADFAAFLEDRSVKSGYYPADLEKALRQLGRASGSSLEIEVAKGIPPEQPAPELPNWRVDEIPEGLTHDADLAFSTAGPPVIMTEKTERVRTDKLVLRKSKFPFLPAKEERVTVTETVSRKERVYVDNSVLGTGWAVAGKRIALIQPARPGLPGKDVSGAPIPANGLTDSLVYAGPGIERRGGELVAVATGFLRWGANWAEVLSFRPHEWKVTRSADNATCLFQFSPGDAKARVPAAEEVLGEATRLGFDAATLMYTGELQDLIAESVSLGTPLTDLSLSASADSHFEVRITEDKTRAVLNLRKGKGAGKPLVLKDVGVAIRASGIKGLNLDRVKEAILSFYRSGAVELRDYVLAEGKPATVGAGGKLEYSVKFVDEKALSTIKHAAMERPAALAGLRSVGEFPIQDVQAAGYVEKEQRVVTLAPPTLGRPGINVFGAAIPGIPGPEPRFKLFENLAQKPNAVIATSPGIFEQRIRDGVIELRVRPHKDAEVLVTLSPNRMEAQLDLFCEEGMGRPLTMEMIEAAMTKAGVVSGVLPDSVLKAFESARENKLAQGVVVARGTFPREGSRSRIKFLIRVASGTPVLLRENGSADFKNRDDITMVDAGARIAEILPPETQPADGFDVTGKVLQARQVPQLELDVGPNIEQLEEDGRLILVARQQGELIYDKKRVNIQTAHGVKGNVDLATGNLKFPGSVVVTGSVTSGFFVVAGGDVRIGEGVEASLVSADGSVWIKQGVKGAGKAVLRAKKDVYVGFVEHAVILAVGDVRTKGPCLRCTIKSNGRVELGGDKAHLVGGSVKARKGVDAANIGSATGVRTEISFGQDYLVKDQVEMEENEVKKLNEATIRLDALMREHEKRGDRVKVDQLRGEKLKNLKLIEKRSLRLFTLRERFEDHFPSQIRVRGTIFAGVVIESHGRYHEIDTPKRNLAIRFNPETGRIEEVFADKGVDNAPVPAVSDLAKS